MCRRLFGSKVINHDDVQKVYSNADLPAGGNKMKILGIDPGIERLGWGIVEKNGNEFKRINSGVKKTLKTQKESERLWEIFVFLDELIKKTRPDAVSTEKLFFAKNVKTALIIGEVRGVILAAAQKHGLRISEFAPLEVKMAV